MKTGQGEIYLRDDKPDPVISLCMRYQRYHYISILGSKKLDGLWIQRRIRNCIYLSNLLRSFYVFNNANKMGKTFFTKKQHNIKVKKQIVGRIKLYRIYSMEEMKKERKRIRLSVLHSYSVYPAIHKDIYFKLVKLLLSASTPHLKSHTSFYLFLD